METMAVSWILTPPLLNVSLDSPPREGVEHKMDMRRVILFSLLDSEQTYIKYLDTLLGYKNVLTKEHVIPYQDIEIIFFKVHELRTIHQEFYSSLEAELQMHMPGREQLIGQAFKTLAIDEFTIAPKYLRNFTTAMSLIQNSCNTNPTFAHFSKEVNDKSKTDKNTLEELLNQPIIQFQRSTYLLNDLIKYTPATHSDYDLLQKTLMFAKNFLDQIDSQPCSSESFDKQRYLAKHSLIVEKLNKSRKLRHIFLFNDVIIGAKQKMATGSNTPYEIKWFVPLVEVSLEDRPKLEEDKSLEENHREEIAACRKKIKELRSEYQTEFRKNKQINDNTKFILRCPKLTNKSLDKIVKKIKNQEAALVMALPCLSFKIFHHKTHKQYILLMSSDYERSDWRETIKGLIGKVQPLPTFTANDAQMLLNNAQMVKATGAVLDRHKMEEEDRLYGSIRLRIGRLQGLQRPSNLFCVIECDSFGHFEKKARTSTIKKVSEPTWDEVFDIDLEGTQTLRLLCYGEEMDGGGQSLLGKGALELQSVWLDNEEKEFTLSLSNKLSLEVTLLYLSLNLPINSEPCSSGCVLFGATFEEIARREVDGIPHLVKCCTRFIEDKGMKEEGIYRISGNLSRVEELKRLFEADPEEAEMRISSFEVHAVSGLIKLFFRSLPDALFTGQLYPNFVDALALKDPDACSKYLFHLMDRLPQANMATAHHIISHLIRVSKEEESNKMGLKNLAVVFGPTLFRPPSRTNNSTPKDQVFFLAAFETVTQVRLLQHVLNIFLTVQVPDVQMRCSSRVKGVEPA